MNTSEHSRTIRVNRAPVLTLWATVVAERLGFNRDAALTLGRAVAGSSAQMKGRALGIYEPSEEPPSKAAEERRERLKPDETLDLLDVYGTRISQAPGRVVPRSVDQGRPSNWLRLPFFAVAISWGEAFVPCASQGGNITVIPVRGSQAQYGADVTQPKRGRLPFGQPYIGIDIA